MFGYVHPSDGRLTPEDRETFRAAYCGLCHALGARYGLAGRMILNYDLTFLAMVLSDGAGQTCARRCVVHPIRKRCCAAEDPALDTAADMSVILTYWQLRDGVADHGFWGGLKYRLASALLRPAYRKARARRTDFDRGTQAHLTALGALEKDGCASLDAPADAFARLLALAAEPGGKPLFAAKDLRGNVRPAGSARGNVCGSYIHLYFGSNPTAAAAFAEGMRR